MSDSYSAHNVVIKRSDRALGRKQENRVAIGAQKRTSLSRRVPLAMTLLVGTAFLTTGCSANLRMPWESNPLDPANIHTTAPLETPPDLEVLPTPSEENAQVTEVPDPGTTSAAQILFEAPRSAPVEPLTRNQREKLPDWLTSP